ncbi:MAG TPA: lipopolysaccharide biosynthesis protein [Pyrinomonadaceae bacterium]|nr:lipopolysaccharide biosynthesis protein [Pyrinomonadaceae bacterium]
MSPSLTSNQPQSSSDEENRHFRTDHLKDDLGSRTARGGVVTVTSQGIKFFIGMAATVVLARLLTPQDYGLIGMVAVVTGFVSMFKDMGLSVATIQKEEITAEQISTLFWVNVALSVCIMLLTAAISPAVAWFYGEPRLTLITIGFAAGFLFSGLTVQHEALLRRQMRFTALAITEITSFLVGLCVAIPLAWRGAGYWALVANQLAQGLTYAVGVWVVCGWRPGKPVRNSGVRPMLAFGGNLTGFHTINYFARNLDNMLIGLVWGSRQLGLYAKAYQLLLLPIDQINAPIAAVAVPALSRLVDSPERYRRAYLRILEKIAMLTMPGMAFMIMTSDWIVGLLLGPQWMEASRVFALLGIAGLVQFANTTGWLFMTQNRAHHMFHWGLRGCTIVIISIVIGLPWGAVGVATSYSLINVCVVIPLLFYFVGREGPVRTIDFYRTVAPSACAALCTIGALFLFRRWAVRVEPVAGLAAAFGITVVTALFVLYALPAGRRALQDFHNVYNLLRKKGEVV